MTDEELQLAYRRAVAVPPTDQCPPPEQLATLVQGMGSEGDRLAVLEHVMRCPTCGPELDLLRAATAGARAADAPRFPVRRAVLAAAAVLVLGVGALALRESRSRPSADVFRGQRPAMTFVEPAAGATLPRPVHLAWHALDGARNYRVELLSARGDMIAAWSTSDTVLAIPDSIRLDASETYDVWVRATRADRSEVSSPIIRFSVK